MAPLAGNVLLYIRSYAYFFITFAPEQDYSFIQKLISFYGI